MNKMRLIFSALLLMMFIPESIAHSGHGFEAGILHDVSHGSWIAVGIVITILALYSLRKKYKNK